MLTQGTGVMAGRYALDRVIGRGGMADVYRATDQVLEREVAVKVLRADATDDSDPDREWDETCLKAQRLLRASGAREPESVSVVQHSARVGV